MKNNFVYKGNNTKEISFPLGGIGSGSIGLAGNGRLIDWEIFNRPNKCSTNGFTHFAIKAESNGKLMDARVLNGDLATPYTGGYNPKKNTFGHGVNRAFLTGFPHFKSAEFKGEYPFAEIYFKDNKFPGKVKLVAFNPLIPLNDGDSSIPAAFFCVEITNNTNKEILYTVGSVLSNPFNAGTINTFHKQENIKLIKLTSDKYKNDDIEFGDMSLVTDADVFSCQQYLYRGTWFDNLSVYWKDFTNPDKFRNRIYNETSDNDHCVLAAHIKIKPTETKQVKFVITWNFPNFHQYWAKHDDCGCRNNKKCEKVWKNYYSTLFKDSTKSAIYSLENWERLYNETMDFKKALFASTLPDYVIDAISANVSILRSPTVIRLDDGSLYGFEGCNCSGGCCEGSCTHVWNYAYALPFLFPNLERSLRDLDYKYNIHKNGKMSFRLQLPIGTKPNDFNACVDGQFGGVIKAYRDWKICGDDKWLKSIWKQIKKSIEHAWEPTNEDKWDLNKDGVLEGRQHHTLDVELFGPNTYLTGFYLAALKAGSIIAEHFGEMDKVMEYRKLFERGKKWVNKNLFNGEYYHQKLNIRDKSILDRFRGAKIGYNNIKVEKFYWSPEHNEIKYQILEGCHIDQVIGQWHANIGGLGEIFDKKQVKRSLFSIYKNNFKKSFRDFFNPARIYGLNDEAGVVICDWPKGKYRPVVPVVYAEECWPGCEYQLASHMVQEGLIREGLEIVRAVRERFNGENRNPWNEFECGSNYARSMSSYSLLLSLSGFEFDMVKKHIGFSPVISQNNFKCFWSIEGAWGVYERKRGRIIIKVMYGELKLNSYSDSLFKKSKKIKINGINFKETNTTISFKSLISIKKGGQLVINV